MAYTGFNFGEMLAQGLAAGQAAKARRDELAFRKSVEDFNQKFRQDEATRQQGNIEEARNIQQSQYATSLASENAFRGKQLGFQERNTSLAEQAQQQLFGQYVDIQGPNGQTAQINIRDLLADQRMRESLRLQAKQYQPFTVTPGQVQSLRGLFTGDFNAPQTFPYQFKDLVTQGASVAGNPLAAMQYGEGLRQMEGLKQTREVLGRAQDRAQFDPTQVAPERPIALQRFLLGSDLVGGLGGAGIPGISHYAAQAYGDVGGQEAKYQERIGNTESYLKNVVNNQAKTLSDIQSIKDPEIRAQAASAVAPQMSKLIGDLQYSVKTSGLGAKAKRELNTSLVKLGGYYLSNMPAGDPYANELHKAFVKAVDKEDTDKMLDIMKVITSQQGQSIKQAQFEQRAAKDRYEQITGQ